jgi:hypothetical protein
MVINMEKIFVLIFILAFKLSAQTEVKASSVNIPSPDPSIIYLDCGPSFYVDSLENIYKEYSDSISITDERFYRVSFVIEEIYYSLMIELVSRGLDEGSEINVLQKYFYSGFDINKIANPNGRLVDLEFNKWKSYKKFTLKEYKQNISIEILSNGNLKVK